MMQPGAMAPPAADQQQHMPPPQYMMPPPAQQPQQQWGMMPPQPHPVPPPQMQYYQAAQPPPPMWGQQPSQIPPPQAVPPPQPMQPQMQYPAAALAVPASQPASGEEIRTLWIGDLQYWMDESYVNSCFVQTGEVRSVKLIRNKITQQLEGYGFIEFSSRAIAEQVLQSYNGQAMPNTEQTFRLNWATLGSGERRDDGPDYTVFVGDLSSDVTDFLLQETFKVHFPSVKGAKVVTDRTTGRSKGYGFVRFGDPNEQTRAMTEMNGMFCSSRQMRVGPATTKKSSMGLPQQQYTAKASYQSSQGTTPSENDPNNTTIFVGGLDPNVTEEALRQVFVQYGELLHVKIPVGKRCGFVQFATRSSAEEALLMLNGSLLGGHNIRLSWGRSPSSKQPQQDPNQWTPNNYYGYQQYESYGYPQPQDPYAYAAAYGNYPGYANYQQQQQ